MVTQAEGKTDEGYEEGTRQSAILRGRGEHIKRRIFVFEWELFASWFANGL
jgi:hypothetical protein